MPLILAIDPDKRQSTQLATLVTTELQAKLVQKVAASGPFDAAPAEAPVAEMGFEPAVVAEAIAIEAAPLPEPEAIADELSIDPVAAQALEELSRQLPAASLADAIPAEAPVPVVDMQTFETLDAIASQFAAPLPKHENVHDLASLFAATPTLLHTAPSEVPGIDPSLFASPAAQPPRAEAAVDRALAPAAPEPIDEEIALDVDALDLAMAAPAAEPAAPADTSFSFTFVDGFGDAWSDFEVASVAAPEPATTPAPEPAAAPLLDDDALSLIGDAAHKASLDVYVIEELGSGVRHVERKATNTHAGATHVAPSAAPAVKKKAPVQDEWGLFDPEQCGFAALEAEDPAERRKPRDGTRVRVISY